MLYSICVTACLALGWQSSAPPLSIPLGAGPQTQRWQFGLSVTAKDAAVKDLTASLPFPGGWPEQEFKVIRQDVSDGIKLSYKKVAGGGAGLLVLTLAELPVGEERSAIVVVDVVRTAIIPPKDTTGFVVPQADALKAGVRACLAPSQNIESDHDTIRTKAKEIIAKQTRAWQKVEALYDWVREHVEDRNSPDKGALKAIENGYGDGLEISSAFVALCRASGVPARLVWLPRHCYPEFYLEDAQGVGNWYPCRTVGEREFGGITEFRPILSKGDKFPAARNGTTDRAVMETLKTGESVPMFKFIREMER